MTAAIAAAGLGPLLAELPEGLDTVIGSGARGISGGERARLGIARALLSERPVILLDEPVAHLDPPTAVAVVADVCRVAGTSIPPRTLIMVTHRDEGVGLFASHLALQSTRARRRPPTRPPGPTDRTP